MYRSWGYMLKSVRKWWAKLFKTTEPGQPIKTVTDPEINFCFIKPQNFWGISATRSKPNIINLEYEVLYDPIPFYFWVLILCDLPYTFSSSFLEYPELPPSCLLHQVSPTRSLLCSGHSFRNYFSDHLLKWAKHELTTLNSEHLPYELLHNDWHILSTCL